jgi:hypothetical protein
VSSPNDRREELLAERALEGLGEEEARELELLGGAADGSFDLAAAALALAELGEAEPLPETLAEKVVAASPSRQAAGQVARVAGHARREAAAASRRRPRWDLRRAGGWVAALAAAVVAVFAWNRPPRVVERVVERVVRVEVPAPPPREPTPVERREELLTQATDARTVAWAATPDPAANGATGDVVWSESRQQGYMRIRGLAANDPARTQYQLWIFDGERDQAHPVDGGVFDVQEGEVVVPIRAAIRVFAPKLFAVTVERPGGVVVSKRERIVLTAGL